MPRAVLAVLALLALPLAGCVAPAAEDLDAAAVDETPSASIDLPAQITGLEQLANVAFDGANDLVFRPGLAFVAASSGMYVVDISDPLAPEQLSMVECRGKDIGVTDLADGRRIVSVSYQGDDGCEGASPAGGIRLVDVTDPRAPVVLSQVALKYGSHTHTPYGDTGILYNSAYNLGQNRMATPFDHHRAEVVDINDPDAPAVVAEFMFPLTSVSIGCHDILAEPEYDRAICAGISETMIWDTTDPIAPKITGVIHNPLITIHHSAATARNGTLLILGDEAGGVFLPGCNNPAPTGALWFYDITDVSNAKLLGYYSAPNNMDAEQVVCTAHNFNVVEGHDLVVSAWYTAGVLLIDFSDPAMPKLVSQVRNGGSAWASYYYDGAVFVGDTSRGLDVLALV